jgi:hypothetical protein
MRCWLRWMIPTLALVVFVPLLVAKDPDKSKVQTKDKIQSSGQLIGKVVTLENSSHNFTVQVEYTEPDPAKVLANAQYDQKRRFEMSWVTNPIEKRKQLYNHAIDMQNRQLDSFRKVTKDIELGANDDVKVRTMILPMDYDAKGKVKKYTKKELAQLKGPNKSLPGYTAEWDNLAKGQFVKVYLAKQKKPKSRPLTKVKKDKDDDKELFTERPKVVMIVILAEPMKKD